MDAAIALDTELGTGDGGTVAGMLDASHDATKLPRVLVTGGLGEAAAALYLALFRTPAGLFLQTKLLLYSYYGVLFVIVLFGVLEAWAGLWVSHDPPRRRAVGMTAWMTVLWVSVLPLLFLTGIGGHTILE